LTDKCFFGKGAIFKTIHFFVIICMDYI
jgi:hypothetical protein